MEPRYGRVTVITPDPAKLKPEVLSKPFILVADLPRSAQIDSVLALPNVMDLLGMPSAGGPPGFVVTQHAPIEPGRAHHETHRNIFVAGFLPGASILLQNDEMCCSKYIGTATSAGLVTSYYEYIHSGLTHTIFASVEEYLAERGYAAIPLINYESSPQILAALGAKLQAPG